MAVKAIIHRGCCDESSIIENPPISLTMLCTNLTVDSIPKLSKKDWEKEQRDNTNIGLVNKKEHLQHAMKEGDPSRMRVLLKYRKDLGCPVCSLDFLQKKDNFSMPMMILAISARRENWPFYKIGFSSLKWQKMYEYILSVVIGA